MSEQGELKKRIQVIEPDHEASVAATAIKREKIRTTHLDFVLSFLITQWIPPIPANYSQLEFLLLEDLGENARPQLKRCLIQDAALLTYVLKEILFLAQSQQSEKVVLHEDWRTSPLLLLETLPIQQLKPILIKTLEKFKESKNTTIKPRIVRSLSRPLVTAIVAESLASALNVDERVAFFVALIRSLGDALLSWNYPNMYRRAYSEARTVSGVHAVLRQGLGFTPFDLMQSLLRQWGIDKVICDNISSEHSLSARNSDPLKRCLFLAELFCNAGERTEQEKFNEDWMEHGGELLQLLGNANFRNLCGHIENVLEAHRALAPEVFKIPHAPGFSPLATHRSLAPNLNSKFIQEALKSFIERSDGIKTNAAIKELFTKVLPSIGFDSGALVDPTGESCAIISSFGAITSQSFERLDHPVQRIKKTALPITEEGSETVGDGRALVAVRVHQNGPYLAAYLEFTVSAMPNGTKGALQQLNLIREWLEKRLKSNPIIKTQG